VHGTWSPAKLMLPKRGNPGARQFRRDTSFANALEVHLLSAFEEDPDKIREP
jgi:hypothetical protein